MILKCQIHGCKELAEYLILWTDGKPMDVLAILTDYSVHCAKHYKELVKRFDGEGMEVYRLTWCGRERVEFT